MWWKSLLHTMHYWWNVCAILVPCRFIDMVLSINQYGLITALLHARLYSAPFNLALAGLSKCILWTVIDGSSGFKKKQNKNTNLFNIEKLDKYLMKFEVHANTICCNNVMWMINFEGFNGPVLFQSIKHIILTKS